MKIKVQKVGSVWHGTIEGHLDVDVRGLTEEIARRKVEQAALRIAERTAGLVPSGRDPVARNRR
jgi:hypothetical protein